jgi:hypothetical protein
MSGAAEPMGTGISIRELDAFLAESAVAAWTPEEDAVLRAYYPKMAAARNVTLLITVMNERFGTHRSDKSIQSRARLLGVQGIKP